MSDDSVDGGGGHHRIEHVSQDVVLAAAGDASGRIKLTGQQWVAFYLAAGVFLLILFIIIINFLIYWASIPSPPNLPGQLDASKVESYRLAVEHYNTLVVAAYDRAMKLFEAWIAAALLPVFTGIVGFIFGRERV